MYGVNYFLLLFILIGLASSDYVHNKGAEDLKKLHKPDESMEAELVEEIAPEDTPCTCGVFLSTQFKKGSKSQPKGEPVLTQEIDMPFMNNALGNKQCTHRCLEVIIKHLPKSGDIICGSVERDVYREKAHLFVKNHSDKWHATNFSAGREFCCKNNEPLKCSQMSQ